MAIDELVVIFENAPGPEPARFVDVVSASTGKSIAIQWTRWDDENERWELGSFVTWEDAARLEQRIERYREALELIARGVWTARNSVESIVWTARQALKESNNDR